MKIAVELLRPIFSSHVLVQATVCLLLVLSAPPVRAGGPAIISPPAPAVPSVAAVFKPGNLRLTGSTGGTNFHAFQVEWGQGATPGSWSATGITLAGGGSSPVTNGLLAIWDSSTITQANYYSLRLTVDNTTSIAQTNTLVYLEPDLYSTNWPHWLDEAPGSSSVMPANTATGRTRLALVNPKWLSSTLPSRLWMFEVDGSSFTTNTLLSNGSYLQPAVGSVDGAPGDEVIVGEPGYLQVYRPDFTSYFLTPSSFVNFQYGQVVLADLDGNGPLDIVALGSGPSDAWLLAWKTNNQVFSTNYPVHLPDANSNLKTSLSANRLLALDMDGDGQSELLVVAGDSGSSFSLRLFRGDGTPANWPTNVVNGSFLQVAAGDLDGDGQPEIVLLYEDPGSVTTLQVFNANGSPRAGWPVQLSGGISGGGLLLADLDRNGKEEIIVTVYATLCVLRGDGSNYPGWPHVGGPFETLGIPVVGDINGDGTPEIVVSHGNFFYGGGQFYNEDSLVAYRTNGTIARSWRLLGANGNQPSPFSGTPVIGDFDGDGNAELAVNYQTISGGGTSGSVTEGVLTVLRLGAPFRPNHRDWPMFFHDVRNSSAAFVAAKLRLSRSGPNTVLSWPRQPDTAVVQFTDNLSTGPWSALSGTIGLSNGLYTTSISITNAHRWYRLQYP